MRVCGWCGRRTKWWWPFDWCRRCRRYLFECGIYLRSGGPPCSYMAELPKPEDG